ncbi:MAG: ABC transporter permease [Paludibacter sp.]|nr:ABC transporter permease [Paludibacter sp.]MDD4198016.1 ABC transporter permease [Paludibacter sp.]MDD4428586.1 ABC transporter permease [Paludibacter sp.]
MSKIALIIKREYTTRVMKPSFIILTFLTPLLIAGMIMVPLLLAQINDDTVRKIVVIDQTGLYRSVFVDNDSYHFEFADQKIDAFKGSREKDSYAAVLYIPEDLSVNPKAATLFSEEQVGMELKSYVSGVLKTFVEEKKLVELNIPDFKELVEKTKVDIDVKTVRWGKDGEEKMGSAELAVIIGMISAFVIYIFIVVYGAQVMSGVVQEKTSRIVEVIISSVKPFQLMMGKIIGIAMVGLTQFALWVILSVILVTTLTSAFGTTLDIESYQQAQMMGVTSQLPFDNQDGVASELLLALNNFDFVQTGILFVLFFLGGYLLYASLFAAIGSAVDNETDTQQFSLPLTLPIIFAIYAAIYSAENPDGPLAFWCSMIPFTSPIVMMVRLPFGVPIWQLALSIGILILSFIASTWVAGKIYRTGILMYGKKITWKEMMKWVFYRD